jgi:alpha-tubulin suppressor-like RCC1 family protein
VHSITLTQNDRVFSWGFPNTIFYNPVIPKLIAIDVVITKTCCGLGFSFLLSCSRDIFAFNGKESKKLNNIKLNGRETKIIDFSCIYCSTFLVALTENNEFIYWGIDEVEEFMKDDRKTSLYPKISFEKFFENKYQKSYKQVMVRIKGFSDSIAENGKYVKEFIEIKRLGKGSFGEVFEFRQNGKNFR